MQSLEAGGMDGDDLALVGETARDVEQEVSRSRDDARILSNAAGGIVVGALAGALLCALIGAVFVGVLVLAWSGLDNRGWVFGLLVGWFAAGGAALGGFVGVYRTTGFSESEPLTLEDAPGALRPKLDATEPVEVFETPDVVTVHPDEVVAAE
jgi:hypothetical protein